MPSKEKQTKNTCENIGGKIEGKNHPHIQGTIQYFCEHSDGKREELPRIVHCGIEVSCSAAEVIPIYSGRIELAFIAEIFCLRHVGDRVGKVRGTSVL